MRDPSGKPGSPSITICRFSTVLCLSLLVLASAGHVSAGESDLVEIGLSLYRYGRMPSGEPVRGQVQGDIGFNAEHLACINCHRRSGLGSSEGGNLVPAIDAETLYNPRGAQRRELPGLRTESHTRRPAYTDTSLRRALSAGVDAAGRPLDPLMPRYQLDDVQVDSLIAYLKTLGRDPVPGVDDAHLHLATIITPGVSPGRRDSMLAVLEAFFSDRGANTRNELRRSSHAPWHIDWKLEAYRELRLHTWSVSGPPDTWGAQLERLYAKQPVFAVVSGIGSGEWDPVHAFCEENELPCLFPNTELPEISAEGFYSLYFHQGMTLEARVVARYLIDHHPGRGPVLQVISPEPEAATAAAVLRDSLMLSSDKVILSEIVEYPGADSWDTLRARYQPGVVVVWARSPVVDSLLQEISSSNGTPPIVIVSGALASLQTSLPGFPGPVYRVQTAAMAQDRAHGEERVLAWMRSRNLNVEDTTIALNAYFAATMTAGAIKMLVGNYSREYLIERIEHGTENSLSSGAYERLSLGPNQRFASRGAHIVPIPGASAENQDPLWIVP